MRSVYSFNAGWHFHSCQTGEVQPGRLREGAPVVLPHNAVELPFAYFDEKSYQHPFTYQKVIGHHRNWGDSEVAIVFDGAMANAKIYLDGEQIAAHKDGYTPFEVRLTGKLSRDDHVLSVVIDGSENPEIPPFGGQIDYLTYAGIYRDAWLRVTAPIFIANTKIETPDVLDTQKSVSIRTTLANPQQCELTGTLRATLLDGESVLATTEGEVKGDEIALDITDLKGITLWDLDTPKLYTLQLDLETPAGTDTTTTRFGFRHAEFTTDGFRLNGKPLKIRGLNRHQSFPYAGYGLGRAAQERDADILKNELKLNMVRTSHYPQSTWFLDRCDEIGLLVFEEIPGWQHIGGASWKAESVENVRRMIRRDWNHPSIVIWGVRINESQDDHDFYAETNRVAHEMDSTRQTGGVRFITESEMLEDVYTMNDFILGNEELGTNRPRTPLRPIAETTGLSKPVPYLVTEYNGHMYPTKTFDQEQRQVEHVLRHLEVMNAAHGDPGISGAIGWCAFDYNTHADFGSGDRICHHGVMDMFREPKFAAYAYKSQCDPDDEVVLKPVTFWARGDRNIGGVLPLVVLTNCDAVEIRYGDNPVKRVEPDRERFPHLPHAPVIIDRRHFTDDELGLWGMKWESAEITGIVDGKPAKTVRFVADPVPQELQVVADRKTLSAEAKDSVRVMVRVRDQVGNVLPFLFEPVSISLEGPAALIGPDLVPLRGGTTGFWIETTGGSGAITIAVTSARIGTTTIRLDAQ